jgi:sporulation protein YlmC with PRC-barrel domain
VAEDRGHPIHYSAVARGTPVYSSDGVEVGKVDQVVDNYEEHILDGFVIKGSDGAVRFADAPEVSRTYERAVVLSVDADAAGQLPPPDRGAPSFSPRRTGRLGRMLGGNWRKR